MTHRFASHRLWEAVARSGCGCARREVSMAVRQAGAAKAGIKSQVGQPCHLQNEVKGEKKGGGEKNKGNILSEWLCRGWHQQASSTASGHFLRVPSRQAEGSPRLHPRQPLTAGLSCGLPQTTKPPRLLHLISGIVTPRLRVTKTWQQTSNIKNSPWNSKHWLRLGGR